jgi:hypothetical protein
MSSDTPAAPKTSPVPPSHPALPSEPSSSPPSKTRGGSANVVRLPAKARKGNPTAQAEGANATEEEGQTTPEPSGSASASGPNTGASALTARIGMFGSTGRYLVQLKTDRSGNETLVPLTNFDCRIVSDVELDDATALRVRHHRLRVTMPDGRVRHINLPATDFASMKWVDQKLGAVATVLPAGAMLAATAIKLLSHADGVKTEVAVAHIGYAQHNGKPIFVSGDTIIAPPGVDTADLLLDLPDQAARFRLPPPPTGADLTAAMGASARTLDVAPLDVMLPLWLMAHRAALPLPPPGYVLWLHGTTGAGKSNVAAIMQCFYGKDWRFDRLPENFGSTGTSLEGAAHHARNVLLVIDDAQGDGRRSRENVTRVAQQLVRGIGNRSSRHRSTVDLRQRPVRDPRAAVIVTAESEPVGHSITARIVVVEVPRAALDAANRNASQEDAKTGRLSAAMSAFIARILKAGPEKIAAWFEAETRKCADTLKTALGENTHERSVSNLADLMATAKLVLSFYKQEGIKLPFDEAAVIRVLTGTGAAQKAAVQHADPVEVFREALNDLLVSGYGRIADRGAGEVPQGDARRWGWIGTLNGAPRNFVVLGWADFPGAQAAADPADGSGGDAVSAGTTSAPGTTAPAAAGALPTRVYLRPMTAYSAVLEYLERAQQELGVTQQALGKALTERGFLKPGNKESARVVKVAGQSQKVWDCAVTVITPHEGGTTQTKTSTSGACA